MGFSAGTGICDMHGGRSFHAIGSCLGMSAGGVGEDICGDIWVEVGDIMTGVWPPPELCGDVVWDMGVGGDMVALLLPPPKLSTIMNDSSTEWWLLYRGTGPPPPLLCPLLCNIALPWCCPWLLCPFMFKPLICGCGWCAARWFKSPFDMFDMLCKKLDMMPPVPPVPPGGPCPFIMLVSIFSWVISGLMSFCCSSARFPGSVAEPDVTGEWLFPLEGVSPPKLE